MYPIKNYKKTPRTYTHGVKTFYSDFHFGEDLIVPEGTPIYAPSNGRMWGAWGAQGGKMCHFQDDRGNIIRFLHCSSIEPAGFKDVGEIIAYSGNTGLSTAPHIHLDISKNKVILTDKNNFINPKNYFMRTLKVTIVTDSSHDWQEVQDFYKERGLDLNIKEVVMKRRPVWKEYSTISENHIDMHWWDRHVAPLASGSDICMYVCKMEWWKNENRNGYANHTQRLGIWQGFARDHVGFRPTKSKLPNNVIGTVIHELSHILHIGAGTADKTHELDNKGKLHEMKINWDKFQGWEIEGATRLFKYSHIEKSVIMRVIEDSMASRFLEGIGYFKRAGGYTDYIPSNSLN